MSNLTGQQINQTYPGLLNLQTATTGITSSLQAIQDGLGNNTGLQISNTQLEAQNIASYIPLRSRFYGNGFTNLNAAQFGALTSNVISATPFYDNGNNSYSAITLNVTTQSATDTVQFAIYTSQLINPNGLFPQTPIISGLTADTTTLGLKTITFPTNISMSGFGAGVYFLVYRITNGGGAPTIRFGTNSSTSSLNQLYFQIYGPTLSFTTNTYQAFARFNNTTNNIQVFSGSTTFDNPYSSTLDTLQSTASIAGNAPGFLLNTVGA